MAEENNVDPAPAERLRALRVAAGYVSMDSFAKENRLSLSGYRAHENGTRGITMKKAELYAEILNSTAAYILLGIGDEGAHRIPSHIAKNALDTSADVDNHLGESRDLSGKRLSAERGLLPIYASERGPGGGWVMNSAPAKEVPLPERLAGIENPKALYMVGDDMFPRIKHGEVIFPHPHELPMPESVVIIIYNRTPEEWVARDLVMDDGGPRIVVRRYGKGNASGTDEIICRSEIKRIVATVSPTYFL